MAPTRLSLRINRSGQARRCLQPRGPLGRRVREDSAQPPSVGGAHVDAAGRVALGVVERLVGAIDEGSRRLPVLRISSDSSRYLELVVETRLQREVDEDEFDE